MTGDLPKDFGNAARDFRADRERTERQRRKAVPNGKEPPRALRSETAIPPIVLETIRASSFANQPIPDRPWLVPNIIPDRQVTILSGDGGTGKSLIALQLSAAVAGGFDWIGTVPGWDRRSMSALRTISTRFSAGSPPSQPLKASASHPSTISISYRWQARTPFSSPRAIRRPGLSIKPDCGPRFSS